MGRVKLDNGELSLDGMKHKKHRKENRVDTEEAYRAQCSEEGSTQTCHRHHFTDTKMCKKKKKENSNESSREDTEESNPVVLKHKKKKKHKEKQAEEGDGCHPNEEENTDMYCVYIIADDIPRKKKKKKKNNESTRENDLSQCPSSGSPNESCEDKVAHVRHPEAPKAKKKKKVHFNKEGAWDNSEAAGTYACEEDDTMLPSPEHMSSQHKMKRKQRGEEKITRLQDSEEPYLLSQVLASPSSCELDCSSHDKKRTKKHHDVSQSSRTTKEGTLFWPQISVSSGARDANFSADVLGMPFEPNGPQRRKEKKNKHCDSSEESASLLQPSVRGHGEGTGPAKSGKRKHKAKRCEQENGAQEGQSSEAELPSQCSLGTECVSSECPATEKNRRHKQQDAQAEVVELQENIGNKTTGGEPEEQETASKVKTFIWDIFSKYFSSKNGNENTENVSKEGSTEKPGDTHKKHRALAEPPVQSSESLGSQHEDEGDTPLFSEDGSSEEDMPSIPATSLDETPSDSYSEYRADYAYQDGLFWKDEPPSSPVDEDFMVYAQRGVFPGIHRTVSEPSPSKIEKYKEETGLTVRTRQFTADEDAILKRNYRNITKCYKLRYPYLFLGLRSSHTVEELAAVKKFARRNNLLQLLGKDLPRRTLRMVYRRARTLFDPSTTGCHASFSKEDTQQLVALYMQLGPKWHEIGRRMGKPADAVRSRHHWWENRGSGKGRWTRDEEMRLQEALKKVGHTDQNGPLPDGVTWDRIAELVGTRSPDQCYKRWLYSHRLPSGSPLHNRLWSAYDTIHLISRVNSMEDPPQNDYDWRELRTHFPVARSGNSLRKKWRYLVERYVPKGERTSPKACVSYIYKHHLPHLLSSVHVSIEDAVKASKEGWLVNAKNRGKIKSS